MKKWVRLGLLALGVLVLYLGAILGHGTLTDYQPEEILPAEVGQNSAVPMVEDSIVRLLSWNLGYGALGAEATFFFNRSSWYAGNLMVRTPRQYFERYYPATTRFAAKWKADVYLLQEVDFAAKRSYWRNQFKDLCSDQPGAYAAYFPNYRVARVPAPLLEPWRAFGPVNSGLATLARFQASSAERRQLPGKFPWPTRLFLLDRCLGVTRFAVAGGKVLTVVNVHNEAFDGDGRIKQEQMTYLRKFLLAEYAQGHYVIAGGDWNAGPPFFPVDRFSKGKTPPDYTTVSIAPDFFPPSWRWIYDPTQATNRANSTPYRAGETFVTILDYFLVSPNVKVLTVKTINEQFRASDHQPVYLEAQLL